MGKIKRLIKLSSILILLLFLVFFIANIFSKNELVVHTIPEGAQVFLNVSTTPKTSPARFKNLKEGTYEIKITKEGYKDLTSTIAIKSKQKKELTLILTKKDTTPGHIAPPDDVGSLVYLNRIDEYGLNLFFLKDDTLLFYNPSKKGLRYFKNNKTEVLGETVFSDILDITYTEDGKFFVTGLGDGFFNWIGDTSGSIKALNLPGFGFSFSLNGKSISYLGDFDFSTGLSKLKLFNIASGNEIELLGENTPVSEKTLLSPQGNKILLIHSPDAPEGHSLHIVNKNGKNLLTLEENLNVESKARFSSDGLNIAYFDSNGLNLINTTGTKKQLIKPYPSGITAFQFAFVDKDRIFISLSKETENTFSILNATTNKTLELLPPSDSPIKRISEIAVNRNGNLVAVSYQGGPIYIFNIKP